MGSVAVQTIGWVGSAFLVLSLVQANVTRLRLLNLVGCVLLIVFNAVIQVWPMVALNVVLLGVNLWALRRLYRDSSDSRAWEVLGVAGDDAYLRHILRLHDKDIADYNPTFVHNPFAMNHLHYIILKGDEMVGVVILREWPDDPQVAEVLLDWVTERYRNLAPGRFVYGRHGVMRNLGYSKIKPPTDMVNPYYARLGLTPEGDLWQLDLRD